MRLTAPVKTGVTIVAVGSEPVYDAENRLTTTAGVTYTYDGDGKRMKKSSSALYWSGAGSDPLSGSDLAGTIQKEHIFFNGKRAALSLWNRCTHRGGAAAET